MKRGKKYVEAAKNIDRQTLYEAADAISLVKKNATAKFDETIEAPGPHQISRYTVLNCR